MITKVQTEEFIVRIGKVPKHKIYKKVLRSWDRMHHIQWNILRDMTGAQSTMTADPVLDSWFAILFSFVCFNFSDPCTIGYLNCAVSGLPSWSPEYTESLLPTFLNSLHSFNYWHSLEFLYFPLNISSIHWILIRVGITTKLIEVFDSLGEIFTGERQKVSYLARGNSIWY